MEDITLRGLIMSKFSSVSEFAKSIGWSRSKTGRIVNGAQELSLDDIVQITTILDIKDRHTFDIIFFPQLSTKWTTPKL